MTDTESAYLIELVKEAGLELMKYYGGDNKVDKKADGSFVSKADIASEEIIISGLKKFSWPILSEETEDNPSRLKKEKVWVLDPLDGTLDFLQRTGEFSIHLGLVEDGKPIFGIVLVPAESKLYFAEKGKGAFIQKNSKIKRIKVSGISKLQDSSFVMSKNHLSEKEKEFVEAKKIKMSSYMGSIGVKIGLIAEGKAEGYTNVSNKTFEWDICASDLILTEAGGAATDLNGKNFVYNKSNPRNQRGILATNGKIHSRVAAEFKNSI